MARLFIAIPLDVLTRTYFKSVAMPNDPALKTTQAEDLHVTLHFLGDVSDAKVNLLRSALRSIRCSPFTLDFRGAGTFGGRDRAEILWAGIELHPQISMLHSSIAECLCSLSLPVEARQFTPHLTLARLKTESSRFAHEFTQTNAGLKWAMQVDEFSLYRSSSEAMGFRYQVLETFPLTS